MLPASRRVSAAKASHSCWATGACSGSIRLHPWSYVVAPLRQGPPQRSVPSWPAGRAARTPSAVRIVTSLSSDSNPMPAPAMSLITIASSRLRSSLPRPALDGALAVLGGEPDERLVLAPQVGERAEHVLGALELDPGDPVLLVQLAVDRARGAEVRDRGAHQQYVAGGQFVPACVGQLGRGVDRRSRERRGGGSSATLAAITRHLGAAAGGLAREREPHPPRGPVADVADAVDRFPRPPRRHQHAEPLQRRAASAAPRTPRAARPARPAVRSPVRRARRARPRRVRSR